MEQTGNARDMRREPRASTTTADQNQFQSFEFREQENAGITRIKVYAIDDSSPLMLIIAEK